VTNATLARLQGMSREQKEERFQELQLRLNIVPEPDVIPRGGEPLEVSLEETEEWEWLRNDLGYK
jgi:hypothetical protein